MRAELHLILWVTAAVTVGAVLFRSSDDVAQIPSVGRGAAMEVSVPATEGNAAVPGRADLPFPRLIPSIDLTARPIFRVGNVPAEVAPPLAQPAAASPVLKGIISSSSGLRAVFVLDPNTTDYSVVSVGDSIGAYQIKDVSMDRVLGVSAGGDEVTFNLRGAGEHP